MSKACPHYLAYTFTHWLAAILITAGGTHIDVVDMNNRGVHFLVSLATLGIIFPMMLLPNGILKYLLFIAFSLLLGLTLQPLEKSLEQKGLLTEVLILSLGVFIPMVLLGFYDKFNLIPWTNYLMAGLVGLIIARLILFGLAMTGYYDDRQITTTSKILSTFAIALFALLTTRDMESVRRQAKACRGNPDYISASLGLFLDALNIFESFGDILSN